MPKIKKKLIYSPYLNAFKLLVYCVVCKIIANIRMTFSMIAIDSLCVYKVEDQIDLINSWVSNLGMSKFGV